jgi:hypothetical protein
MGSSKGKSAVLWIAAILITIASAAYQRMTGPTYPIKGSVRIGEMQVNYDLLTSHVTTADARMQIIVPDENVEGEIKWKRFKSNDEWSIEQLDRIADTLFIAIPKQPAAGKVIYQIILIDENGNEHPLASKAVIIRFKNHVPVYVLIPHIILIFAGMLLATRTGLEAIFRNTQTYTMIIWTAIFLFLGGLVFGPLVQKAAFNEYWTGWPFGHDLTDSKTAFAMIFWIIALFRGRKRDGRAWTIIASVLTLVIFLIPHSILGSEIDYTKMK